MSVKVEDLPKLIGAAVQKAIDEKQLTDASLQSILHGPFTIGILPAEPLETTEQTTEALRAERLVKPPKTIGIRLDGLDELQRLGSSGKK